jgi:sarcosine oxidase subunit gamma
MAEESWGVAADGLVVRRAHARKVFILRLRGASEAQLAALGEALGAPLPGGPNRATGAEPRILGLAPGDWMVVGAELDAEALAAAVRPALVHVADVTAGRIAFEVSGARACDLLAKGVPLDLHERAFPADSCAQTVLAQTHVLIDRPGSADGALFTLYADVSYAAHLSAWFQAAAAEFR